MSVCLSRDPFPRPFGSQQIFTKRQQSHVFCGWPMRGGPKRFCMRLERNRTGPTAAPPVATSFVSDLCLGLDRWFAHHAVPIRGNDGVGPLSCAAPTLANCHEPTRALIRAKKWWHGKDAPRWCATQCAWEAPWLWHAGPRPFSLFNFLGHGS
jgi:hypothetical protein